MTLPTETPKPEHEPRFDEPEHVDPPEIDACPLWSCLDVIGQLFRSGLFLLVLVAPVFAGRPARVWIDGHDIDGPPPGPEPVPQWIGGSIWGALASSKLKAQRTGAAATTTNLEDVGTINASVFGHYGYWWGQLDILRLERKSLDSFVLDGAGFGAGATLGSAIVVTRAAREMFRFDMPWGSHYHIDFGLRYTLSGFSISNGVDRQSRNQGFLCPEVSLIGVTVLDRQHAIHTRTSIASNGASTGRETSIEFAITYNNRILETPDSMHDVSIGIRGLSTKLGFTDKATGQETTSDENYFGPELSYTYRW